MWVSATGSSSGGTSGGCGELGTAKPGQGATRIASGHVYGKRVKTGGEFPGVTSKQGFARVVDDVIPTGQQKKLPDGRTAYWKDGTIVIKDPSHPDGGTAFRPTDGKAYFDRLRQ